jgi:hypothetical protein
VLWEMRRQRFDYHEGTDVGYQEGKGTVGGGGVVRKVGWLWWVAEENQIGIIIRRLKFKDGLNPMAIIFF